MRPLTIKGNQSPAGYPVRRMNVCHEQGLNMGRQMLPHRAVNLRGANPTIQRSNQFLNILHKSLNRLRPRLHSL